MYSVECNGINSLLVNASRLLLKEGRNRISRGKECVELPEPIIIKIKEPTARYVTIPQRKWNVFLPFAESLWLASGRNDIPFIVSYLKRMADFSDDGEYMRGGYGPRLRHYNGSNADYMVNKVLPRQRKEIDQFEYIVNCFNQDVNTRRAIITLCDPIKDCFDENNMLKQTVDIPCTRSIHFIKQANSNKLDLIVHMRSNDLIWGASAVNIFNYTFMQEYFSAILGMEIGYYYHIVDNLHYYKDKQDIVKGMSAISLIEDVPFVYKKTFTNLNEFDCFVSKLSCEEQSLSSKKENDNRCIFQDDFFQDWYDVLRYKFISTKNIFVNPVLNRIIK